ncbi:MAG: HAD family hydrolase [Porticoccus sp.]|jgi:phosphoglycolate phosphatase|nr:HAD family hydrolase [Porticoccus sp.]
MVINKLLIFDWDGTLCDSLSRISYCILLAARENGHVLPLTLDPKSVIGLGLYQSFQTLFDKASDDQIMSMCASYSRIFIELDNNPSPMFSGALGLLQDLKKEGYYLAIATGKSRKGLNRALLAHKLNKFFDASRCSDETKSKPNPLMLNEILEELNILPKNAIMIGDTSYDLQMALNANMPSIGVSYGAHKSECLKKYDPLICIKKIEEIKYIVKQYFM